MHACVYIYMYMVAPPRWQSMPFQVSRSAWSVIGWVTISPPKINSEVFKILAPNFRDVQSFNKVPGTPKFQKF